MQLGKQRKELKKLKGRHHFVQYLRYKQTPSESLCAGVDLLGRRGVRVEGEGDHRGRGGGRQVRYGGH